MRFMVYTSAGDLNLLEHFMKFVLTVRCNWFRCKINYFSSNLLYIFSILSFLMGVNIAFWDH